MRRVLIGALLGLALAPATATAAGPVAGTASVQRPSATVRPSCAGAQLRWRTRGEVDNLGWNVYRLKGRKRVKLTKRLLAGSAIRSRGAGQRRAGRSYAYLDRAGLRGHRYFLQDVALNGRKRWHGPFTLKGRTVKPVANTPFLGRRKGKAPACAAQNGPGGGGKPGGGATGPGGVPPVVNEPGRPSGIAKLGVEADGWYRVSLADLADAGVDISDPSRLVVTTSGAEQAAQIREGALEFHGRALDSPFTTRRAYLVSRGDGAGPRVARAGARDAADGVGHFPAEAVRENRSVYFSALRNGPGSNFFGEVVSAAGTSPAITLPDLATAEGAELEVSLAGVTTAHHAVSVHVNDERIGTIEFDGQQESVASFPAPSLHTGQNTVRLTATGSGDVTVLGSLRASYRRELRARDDELSARVAADRRLRIEGFSHREIRVMDVTDPAAPVELPVSTAASGAGYAASFTTPEGTTRRILAFGEDRVRNPASIARDAASDWRAAANQADLLIITDAKLRQDLQPLVDRRRAGGLRTEVALTADVYDEFGHSMPSDRAIRAFLEHARGSWSVPPRYVILAGDGTHDPLGYLGKGRATDVIPVHLADTSFMESPDDNWFADVDADGALDVALGRLPISTSAQAQAVVAKLLAYDGAARSRKAVFAADSESASFAAGNQEAAALLPGDYARTYVVKGEDGARSKLHAALGEGPSVVNYMGHGSVDFWSGDLLTGGDAPALENAAHPSLYLMLTCLNGYFSDPALTSLGERLLLAPGGSIATWASSGQTVPGPQVETVKTLLRTLFPDGAAGEVRLGDATRAAVTASPDPDIRRTFALLGDPTVVIR